MQNQKKVHGAAALLGKLGGAARTKRKAKAVRTNGRKGGRPSKLLPQYVADAIQKRWPGAENSYNRKKAKAYWLEHKELPNG